MWLLIHLTGMSLMSMVSLQWRHNECHSLKSPAYQLFAQLFVQKNIKAPHHWPFLGESPGNRCVPLMKANDPENVSSTVATDILVLKHQGPVSI